VKTLEVSRGWYEENRDLILLVVLFAAFRVFTLLLYRPGGYIYDFSDFLPYISFAQLSDQGYYPFVHYWMEYPPVFPWLTVGLYRLSLWMPPWVDPRLGFYTLLGLGLLPFSAGSLALVYLIGDHLRDRKAALRSAVIYALLFAPVYVGTGWFDHVPMFFLLLGLYWLIRGRDWPAGLAVGLGFMAKLTPVLLVPLGLRSLRDWPSRARFAVASAAAVVAISAPFLWLNAEMFSASFRSMLGRSSWETPWALVEGYFGYGIIAGDRFNPNPDFANHPSALPWVVITIAFGLIYLWLYTRRLDFSDARRQVAFAALSAILFLLYSKGYSPQFVVMLSPFVALLIPSLRGIGYLILLDLGNLFEAQAYFILFPQHPWILAVAVALRILILLALAVEFGVMFFDVRGQKFLWSRRWVAGVVASLTLIAWIVVGFRLGPIYGAERYAQERLRPAIERVLAEAEGGDVVLVTADHGIYRRLYPFLASRVDLYVVDREERVPEIASQYGEIWVLDESGEAEGVRKWVEARAAPPQREQVGSATLWRYAVSGEAP